MCCIVQDLAQPATNFVPGCPAQHLPQSQPLKKPCHVYQQEAEARGRHLVFYCGPSEQYKANAAVLVRSPITTYPCVASLHRGDCMTFSAVAAQVGIFQVMLLQRSADRAYSLLQAMEPFLPFRDASMGTSTFDLTVLDCLRVRTSTIARLTCSLQAPEGRPTWGPYNTPDGYYPSAPSGQSAGSHKAGWVCLQ